MLSDSQLSRGRKSIVYAFPYNGNYFWTDATFRQGDVLYNGKLYRAEMLNIDAASGELLVRCGSITISPDSELVAAFTMGGRSYINLSKIEPAAPKGYFEVLSDGKTTVWRQVRKTLYSESGDHNGKEIGYEDPSYRSELLTYFRFEEYFFGYGRKGFGPLKLSKSKKKDLTARPVSAEELFAEASCIDCRESDYPAVGIGRSSLRERESLPAGFFVDEDARRDSERERILDEESLIAQYQNKVYEIGSQSGSSRAVLSGRVMDVSSREPLAGVLVSDRSGVHYSVSDAEGRYSLELPVGETAVSYSEYSREDMRIRMIIHGSGSLDVLMKEKVTALSGATVSADSRAAHHSASMGIERISIKTIEKIPTAFGEGDVLKAVLTLPGVKTVGEASGGFNVRGGSADQNLILFDEGTVYNPSHLFGIFSAFNPDVVSGVELYKSSIPAEFGGRVSSVLDVRTRDGAFDRFHANVGIGVLTSRATLETPIVKDRTSLFVSGRMTYSDWILRVLPANSGYSGGSAGFGDVNAGFTHKFSERTTLRVRTYWSTDRFAFSADTSFRYSSLNASAVLGSELSESTTLSASVGFDSYRSFFAENSGYLSSYDLESGIRQYYLRTGLRTKVGDNVFSYGAQALMVDLAPGSISPSGESQVAARTLPSQRSLQPSVYAGDVWSPSERFSLDAGVRLSGALNLSDHKFHFGPEGRISLRYSPSPVFSLKAGFNNIYQYIHLISNSSSISPMDTYQLCGADVEPVKGYQAAGGLYWTPGRFDISLEGYYKRTDGALDYKSGATLVMNENLPQDLVQTLGKSYGVELMVRKSTGKLTGWVSYTFSRAFLKEKYDRGIATIEQGAWYRAPYDKPHDVKVVANYALTHRFSFSANLDYSTGRPVTIPVSKYRYGGEEKLYYSGRNGYRIPDYFRLDIAFNVDPGHYKKALAHTTFTIGCYNVTGRRNAYSVYYTANGSKVSGNMLCVFACPVPYLNINIKF